MEGKSDQVVQTRKSDIRNKVTKICYCNVNLDPPIPEEIGLFDIIHSNLVLENTSNTLDEYLASINKLKKYYLSPGGYIVLFVSLERTYYQVDSKVFNTLYLTTNSVETILEKAGLKVVYSCEQPYPDSEIYQDGKALGFFVGSYQ